MLIGGVVIGFIVCALLVYAACYAWVAVSAYFRAIWKAESLVYEYHKNRKKFLEWLEME